MRISVYCYIIRLEDILITLTFHVSANMLPKCTIGIQYIQLRVRTKTIECLRGACKRSRQERIV